MLLFSKAVIEALELSAHVIFLMFAFFLQVMFFAGVTGGGDRWFAVTGM